MLRLHVRREILPDATPAPQTHNGCSPKSPSPRPARTTPPAPCFNRRLVCVLCFHARFRQLRNRRPPRILSAPAADSMTPGLLSYSRTPAQRTLCRVPPMRVSFGSPPRSHPADSPHAFLPHRLSASPATAPSCAAPFPQDVPLSRLVTTAGPSLHPRRPDPRFVLPAADAVFPPRFCAFVRRAAHKSRRPSSAPRTSARPGRKNAAPFSHRNTFHIFMFLLKKQSLPTIFALRNSCNLSLKDRNFRLLL